MDERYSKKSVIGSAFWKVLERGSSMCITLCVTILLARILPPESFGTVAMVNVFIALSDIFITNGLGTALIQKKEADSLDFSSAFWTNTLVAIILYAILFVSAPFIESFYGYKSITLILRVLGLRIIISSVNAIQCAYISKNMMFRYYFYSTLIGKFLSGAIGIIMALVGLGIWALVGQSISLILVETAILWFGVKWRPSFTFSFERARSLYSFAWKIIFESFVREIYKQLRALFIGKKCSAVELAYYDKGAEIPSFIMSNLEMAQRTVMFPVLSNAQDEKERLLLICRRWVKLFSFVAFPVLIGMISVSEQLILLLLTEKWLPAVPFMQLACITYISWIADTPIREGIKSIGLSGVCLKIQIIESILAIVALVLVMDYGVMYIAVAGTACSILNILVVISFGKKYLGYSPIDFMRDIGPSAVLALFMGCITSFVGLLSLNILLSLVIKIIVGVISYVLLSAIFKNESFLYCLNILKAFTRR